MLHLRRLMQFPDDVQAVTVSPTGGSLAIATGGHAVYVWELASPGKVQTMRNRCTVVAPLLGRSARAPVLAYSHEGARLACSSWTTVRIWDIGAGTFTCVPLVSVSRVTCLAFSLDGRTLAVGTVSGRVQTWDIPRVRS